MKALDDLLEVVPGCELVQQGAKCPICNAPTGYSEEVGECEDVCCWALRVIKLKTALSR